MGRVVVLWTAVFALLCGVAQAGLPAAHQLSEDELQDEMARNRALKTYVSRNGVPDLAETHPLSDRPPWDAYEVVLYYLDGRREIRFARAAILGRPDIQLVRSERQLSSDEAAAVAARATRRGAAADLQGTRARAASDLQGSSARLAPDERAEAAARRAEHAANAVEAAAVSAERAADRAEAVTARMESAFHRALRK
jgi:hypothetical protein